MSNCITNKNITFNAFYNNKVNFNNIDANKLNEIMERAKKFNKLFKKGYSSKNGLTYSFPELFEEQLSLYNLDTIVFRDNYNCSIISSKEIENYFDSITDSN